jgi:hypothetical protein
MKQLFARAARGLLCASLCWLGAAQADTLYEVGGPQPFGFVNQHVMTMSWSQSNTYTNVSISAPLADFSNGGPIGGTEGIVYLVNQIGPGTTMANDVAPPVLISGLTASFTTQQLWTGLTLPPGTYYLVFASVNNWPMSMSPQGSSTPSPTIGPGVTPQNYNGLADFNAVDPFPPASAFLVEPGLGNLVITVTGDPGPLPPAPAAVPLLGTEGLAALALAAAALGLAAMRRRRT